MRRKPQRNGAITLTGLIVREGDGYYSLCPELDVASQGSTIARAKSMLREAVSLHLESCIESNLPYLRPVPPDEDPRRADPDAIVATFRMKVDLAVKVHA